MPITFVLALDTTAPAVTWGGVGGAVAGSKLVVGYTLDEPQAVAARLVLSDRTLTATLFSNRVEVLLPPDTPAGLATVELDVVDDVGNAATRTNQVLISGTPAPPPIQYESVPSLPGAPVRRRREKTAPRESRQTRTRVASRATSRVGAGFLPGAPSQIRTRVSTYVVAATQLAEVSALTQRTLTTVRVSASTRTEIGARATSDRRRRDDPALLALLLVD